MIRKLALTALFVVPVLCVGCLGPEPQGPVDKPEDKVVHRIVNCGGPQGPYYWDSDDPQGWYWIDGNG